MKITGTKKDLDELMKKDKGLNMPKQKEVDQKQKENEELRKVFKGEKK